MAYLFASASSQYLIGGSAPVTVEPITISCWYKPTASPTVNVVVSINNATGNDRFMLVVRNTDMQAIRIDAAGSSTTANAASATNNAGEWVHAVAVFRPSGQNIEAYRNGAIGTPVANPGTSLTVNRILIGARLSGGVGGAFANGDIAEPCVWNAILTPDEIIALFDGYRPELIRPASRVFYADLIRTPRDRISGTSLSLVGSPSITPHPRRIG